MAHRFSAATFVLRQRAFWLLTRFRRPLLVGFTLLLFALALMACWHLLRELDPQSLRAALADVPGERLGAAALATVLGFLALTGYEWSACRYARVRLPASRILLGGVCAFGVGNLVGVSLLSGGSVRYRLYGREGVPAGRIARITLFASLSLGCALPPLAAAAALANLPAAAAALRLPAPAVATLAALVLAGTLAVFWVLWRRRVADDPDSPNVEVALGPWRGQLPGLRLSLLQLAITLADMVAAASVLYVLLPEAPPFASFLLVYLLALAAGVLSHVPGGIGVFESIMLAAFAGELGAAPLAAGLLLYRLIYVGAPFATACALLLLDEARRLLPSGRQALRLAYGPAAPVLALLVFLAGVVLLFSGATPGMDHRLRYLSFLVPHRLIDLSHFATSLVGVLCLLLAQGLRQRLSAAWLLTMVLLLGGAGLSLLRGFDWEEALLLCLTAGLLGLFRPAFYRPSRLLELPFGPLDLTASVCVLGAATWLMFFTFRDVPYSHALWWQFAVDAHAPRALRAALGSGVLMALLGLLHLLRPAPAPIRAPDAAERERARAIVQASRQPEGGLALSGDKALLFRPQGDGFLMYARQGRSLVALFDPVGPADARAELVWQFRDLCDRHHSRPVFYQVRAENLPAYVDAGLSAVKLGEEAIVELERFDLDSPGMKDLRYAWNRGQRDGLRLTLHDAGSVPLEALREISDAWMAGKPGREKGFSLGRFDPDYLRHFRIALVTVGERPVAFANLLETGVPDTATLDLMRLHPEAPKLTMEFLMLGLIQQFKASGYRRFSLGMVPLSGLRPRRGAPLALRMGALLFKRGERFYNFKGLRRFKEKFQPHWEPRYLAVPTGTDPLLALADVATLIAGGYGGLIGR